MKVYAKQVPPEYQESPLFLFNDWPEDMAICGNRDFDSHCPEVFTRVYKALQDGELCEALSTFEAEYFNTGTEWIVHDGDSLPESPEDINGYFVYCTSWNEDGIANEIADSAGGRPEDVKLWAFDGYMQSPKYREVI